MAFTSTDLDSIKRAIASGQRRVTFGDRTIEYRDMSEMIAAKRMIEQELAEADRTVPRLRRMRYKGLDP